jgi:lysophospholipase L1-like esterase
VLHQLLPNHILINAGKGGDTIVSLYHRLSTMKLQPIYDLSVLWVGVNDIYVHVSPTFPLVKRLCRQPWSKNHDEFQHYYKKTLDLLAHHSKHIITVSPLCISEDFTSPWNKELDQLAHLIQHILRDYEICSYLDLRKKIQARFPTENSSFYQHSILSTIHDALRVTTPEQSEEKAQQRGLRFTIDGIHLNHAGAQAVAELFYEHIINLLPLKEVRP